MADLFYEKIVSNLELLIEQRGVTSAIEAVLEAVINIRADNEEEFGEEYFESQEYKNYEHCEKVLDHVMTACDLNIIYGYGEARKVAMERFKENIRELESPEMLKEQA